jgi:hypothetical protein
MTFAAPIEQADQIAAIDEVNTVEYNAQKDPSVTFSFAMVKHMLTLSAAAITPPITSKCPSLSSLTAHGLHINHIDRTLIYAAGLVIRTGTNIRTTEAHTSQRPSPENMDTR